MMVIYFHELLLMRMCGQLMCTIYIHTVAKLSINYPFTFHLSGNGKWSGLSRIIGLEGKFTHDSHQRLGKVS